MVNKLLSIKKDNNIIVYNVKFDEKELQDYLDYLSLIYGYKEKTVINTSIINNVPLSMGKYDYMKNICKVKPEYKVIKELGMVDPTTKKAKIEITVAYYSMLSEMLRQVFLSKEPLINATKLIKLTNHLLEMPNNFTFNKLLDLNVHNKSWDDPGRGFLNLAEYERYIDFQMRSVNADDIKLNKLEKARIKQDISEIIEKLDYIFTIVQIGMFPIEKELPPVQEVLKIYGERNEEFEYFYGSLDNVPINIDGANLINDLINDISKKYSAGVHEDKTKQKINHYSKVKSFLKF